jgi:hypothetical protein
MTLRESYIQALLDLFRDASGFPATPERSLKAAFSREEGTIIVVHRGKEFQEDAVLGYADRHCEVLVSVISRDEAPDRVADDVMEIAHPLIMNFCSEKLVDVVEGPTDQPLFSNVDPSACVVTTHYVLRYRTQSDSLVQ